MPRGCPARFFDVCIVCGDVSDDIKLLTRTLEILRRQFDEVMFVVGNHDLWVRDRLKTSRIKLPFPSKRRRHAPQIKTKDSVDKLCALLNLCAVLKVHTRPLWLHECNEARGCRDHERRGSTPPGGLLAVPMLSWHHQSWDDEPELDGSPDAADAVKGVGDSLFCRWPTELDSERDEALAKWFAELNEPALSGLSQALPAAAELGRSPPSHVLTRAQTMQLYDVQTGKPSRLAKLVEQMPDFATRRKRARASALQSAARLDVSDLNDLGFGPEPADERRPFTISFSHFCPRIELLPEKRFYESRLKASIVPKVSGSRFLEAQVRQLQPDVHCFGHTHIPVDMTLEGIRYVQWPLGAPREQVQATQVQAKAGFLCIFDGSHPHTAEAPQQWTALGAHYHEYERDLRRTEPAPWLAAE